MNPKLPLDGRIYTLTVGSVLTTNVFQTNLCQLLFRATLKVRLDSCLSLLLEWTTLTAPKWMHISKKIPSLFTERLIHEWKQSPPLPLQLLNNSRLFHTQPHFSFLYCIVVLTIDFYLFIILFLSRSKIIFKVLTTTWRVPPGNILTNYWMPMPTGNGEIPDFTDSEWLKTPKTDCTLKV